MSMFLLYFSACSNSGVVNRENTGLRAGSLVSHIWDISGH